MKKQEESQPIDDLFARKLGNASLSPSPDGFERLQARMSQAQPEAQVVIWRNPTVQRYVAIAACLLLVCLFGWLYLRSDYELIKKGEQVANSVEKPQKNDKEQTVDMVDGIVSDKKHDGKSIQVEVKNHLAVVNKPVEITHNNDSLTGTTGQFKISSDKSIPASENEQPVLAQLPQRGNKANMADTTRPENVNNTKTISANAERVAENTVKPVAPVERVLTVTIEEPTSLVVARQIAGKQPTTVNVTDENPEKETKGNLWQQVKRIKQGEVFARRDNPNNEDKGLLGRAYSGLKQSFEKDKSEK